MSESDLPIFKIKKKKKDLFVQETINGLKEAELERS